MAKPALNDPEPICWTQAQAMKFFQLSRNSMPQHRERLGAFETGGAWMYPIAYCRAYEAAGRPKHFTPGSAIQAKWIEDMERSNALALLGDPSK